MHRECDLSSLVRRAGNHCSHDLPLVHGDPVAARWLRFQFSFARLVLCAGPPTGGFLALRSAFARRSAFGRSPSPILLRMNAEVVPRCFREVNVVVVRSFLNVREPQSAVGIGDIDDLIEPSDGVTHVPFIGQRLFPLFRKGKNAVRQVALLRKPSVFLVRHPGRSHRELLSLGSLGQEFRDKAEWSMKIEFREQQSDLLSSADGWMTSLWEKQRGRLSGDY